MKLIYKLGALLVVSVFSLVVFAGNTYASGHVFHVRRNVVVRQSNHASIFNAVVAEAETGDNDANGNTGGSVSVTTGNARVTVTITNTVNQNSTP